MKKLVNGAISVSSTTKALVNSHGAYQINFFIVVTKFVYFTSSLENKLYLTYKVPAEYIFTVKNLKKLNTTIVF